jgi:hypothetical protein
MRDTTKYKLSDFSNENIEKAKEFIKLACLGYISATIDNKVDIIFEAIQNTTFEGIDVFHFLFKIDILGRDLLEAIGAACNNRKTLEKE